MIRKRKTIDELTVVDDYMFGRVMSRPPVASLFLEALYGRPVEKIHDICVQSVHQDKYDSHGVRFDVEFRGDDTLYDIEMQQYDSTYADDPVALINRARYYHASMITGVFKPGDSYRTLLTTQVIFICEFDPFRAGLPIYTQVPRILEMPTSAIRGGNTTYLNFMYPRTHVNPAGLSPAMIEYLDYLRDPQGRYHSDLCKETERSVSLVKRDNEERRTYMSLQETIERECRVAHKEGRDEGLEEGRKEMQERNIRALMQSMRCTEEEARKLLGLSHSEPKAGQYRSDDMKLPR